jgi:trk system potassium uptake protein TrkA
MSRRKQAIVIGLGQFGTSLARALNRKGVEVLGVDVSEERIRDAAAFLDDTAIFDATDAAALARTSPERRDICVCAIGDDSREASIICTALLRQMGAPRVIARANTELHTRILTLVGAHLIVNPEREFGDRFASQLLHEDVLNEMALGGDLILTEVRTPAWMVGKNLLDLQLPRKYGITVVAVRAGNDNAVLHPNPNTPLMAGDVIIVVAKEGAVASLMEQG